MPKLLVLFQSRSADAIRLAEAAADGARTVRFAEVDLRRLAIGDDAPDGTAVVGRAHRALEHAEDVAPYDGVIFAAGGDGTGGSRLAEVLAAVGSSLANKVGAVVTPTTGDDRRAVLWSALGPMADQGMILVPVPFADVGAADAEHARALGKRVAEVIGWVTHARSHHHHEHHHDHGAHHQH